MSKNHIFICNMHGDYVVKYAILCINHTPTLILLLVPSKTKKRKTILPILLHHFRRWRDCTEHVQQAVKPLGYPRGGVLSPEGFQRITPTKSIKERRQMLVFW